jgi:prepilin-type N-terminal cleavage/methylation domain-containing protein
MLYPSGDCLAYERAVSYPEHQSITDLDTGQIARETHMAFCRTVASSRVEGSSSVTTITQSWRCRTQQSPGTASAGFTLVEILVVLAIIAVLTGIALPVYGVISSNAKKQSTQQLISSTVAAMTTYSKGTTVQATGDKIRRMWDFNGDGIIDGDPQRDPDFTNAQKTFATAAQYSGFVSMIGTAIPKRFVDTYGRPIDGWGSPLRIAFSQELYGKTGIGIWSLGKDKTDQSGEGDDLVSWKQKQ